MKPWQETWLLKFLVLSHLLDLTPDPDARFFFILTLSLESIKVEAAHILMRLRCQVFFFLSSLPPRYFKPLVRKHRHTKPHPGSTSGSDLLPPRPPLTFQTSQDCILMVWTVEADQRTHAHTGLRSGSSILSGENLFSSLLCNWGFFCLLSKYYFLAFSNWPGLHLLLITRERPLLLPEVARWQAMWDHKGTWLDNIDKTASSVRGQC